MTKNRKAAKTEIQTRYRLGIGWEINEMVGGF